MNFHCQGAEFFIPDCVSERAALGRTTHLCVGAHPDDIEMMAYHGIAQCFGRTDLWFGGVVVTGGAGSPRGGAPYGSMSEEQMMGVRRSEQRKAAIVGEYSFQAQLAYGSDRVKRASRNEVRDDLRTILAETHPAVVYVHNPADRHDTHVAVFSRTLEAIRLLPVQERPRTVYGCEGWRDLDWLPDDRKVMLDVAARPHIAMALIGVFDSQIAGGKRYDRAVRGRRAANATFHAAHATDETDAAVLAIDLTPLTRDPALSVEDFASELIEEFRDEVRERLHKFGRRS